MRIYLKPDFFQHLSISYEKFFDDMWQKYKEQKVELNKYALWNDVMHAFVNLNLMFYLQKFAGINPAFTRPCTI